ncbi:DUF2249 domain-containing protein [Luteimicrobium sp. DT211]|uniref:DUF2249 domain-containing protein n=1 Tax=Luteimicrobium sp. DT211 TaxID=3393412 RepID=UPI003CEE0BC3
MAHPSSTPVLDLRDVREADRRPTVLAAFRVLPVGGSLVLVADDDPAPLRDALESELPGSYTWDGEPTEAGDARVRVGRLTSTALPRVVTSTRPADDDATVPSTGGAVWSLRLRERDLDSNVVALPPRGEIGEHAGPDVDVLFHVVDGAATIVTEGGDVAVGAGDVVWLPRRSRRRIVAGKDGVRYLTVHRHREGLALTARTHV